MQKKQHAYGVLLAVMRITFQQTLMAVVFVGLSYAKDLHAQELLDRRVSLSVSDMNIESVLDLISRQTNARFVYSPEVIRAERLVSVRAKGKRLEQVLESLLKPLKIDYSITSRGTILLKSIGAEGRTIDVIEPEYAVPIPVERTLTGRVTDEKGEGLPGVNIVIKGSQRGTVSDVDGNYNLVIPDGEYTVTFSFVGYLSEEVLVAPERTVVDITLKVDEKALEEVIVVGYGTQKKSTLTGSVSNITGKEVMASPAVGISNSLAGMLPGVTALNRTGEPGADVSTITIRGRSTTGSTSPLVVVDGIQNPSGWERINQNDIESISVLKDASAAIYGSQAANGVILITTKRGQTGKPQINYSFNQALTQPTRLRKLANSAQFAEYLNDLRAASGQNPAYTEEEIEKFRQGTDPLYQSSDWVRDILKKFAPQSMHNLNVRGGSEAVRYSISGSYANQNSIFKKGMHEFDSYTLRSNIDARVSKNLNVNLDINAGWDDRVQPGSENPWPYFNALPWMPVYYPNGYPSAGIEQGLNPAVMVTDLSGNHNTKTKRFQTKAGFDYSIPWVTGMKVDGFMVFNNNEVFNKRWRTPWTVYNYNRSTDEYIPLRGGRITGPELTQNVSSGYNTFYNLRLSYQKSLNGHEFNTFIAYEQSKGKSSSFEAFRRGFLSATLPELFAGDLATQQNTGSSSESARQSVFGRFGYNFMDKYLLDFNLRFDGSHAFPKGNRWGFFPGFSAAWVISQESFLKDSRNISELKLRVSSGRMGNDAISAYQFLASYLLNNQGYHFGSTPVSSLGLVPGVTPNPNITWEVANSHNLGLDAAFFNGIIGVNIDAFKQRRSNILAKRDLEIPAYTSLVLPNENIGIVENKGFELQLTHRNRPAANALRYSVSGNIAYAKSKVIDLSEAQDVPDYQKAEGRMLGSGLYYDAIGIIRTEAELESIPNYAGSKVGDLKYRDVDNNGVIDARDRVRFERSNIPQITFGLNASVSFKNLSLFANFAGQAKAWQYIHQYASVGVNTLEDLIVNRYRPGSMDSKYPILPASSTIGGQPSGLESTFWLQNASFVRLKTLELSYTFSDNLIKALSLGSLRVYLNGSNLFTISEMTWYDPEGNATNGAFYPQNKIFNLGVNLAF